MKFLKGIGVNVNNRQMNSHVGLWPPVLNLATKALISTNATCGEGGREEFCRLQDGPARNHHFAELIGGFAGGSGGGSGEHGGRCGVCDNFSRDPHKRHPINYAIDDGNNRWWQSPPLHYGEQYEYVTITLDLKQVIISNNRRARARTPFKAAGNGPRCALSLGEVFFSKLRSLDIQ